MEQKKNVNNVRYQLSFLIKLSAILVLSSVVSGVIFKNFVSYNVGSTYTSTRFVLKSVNDFLLPSLWFSITIFTLILSIGTIIVSILVSHKIAGPLYRIENTFKDFKEGIFYTISIRPNDQVQEFVKLLNEFVDSLRDNFTNAKKHSLNIKDLLNKEKTELSSDKINFQQLSALNDELKNSLKDIKNILDTYKTEIYL